MRDLYSSDSYKFKESAVCFKTDDEGLQGVFDDCESLCKENVRPFNDYDVIIEGAKYIGVWLETQPMGGEMYAKRDIRVALNNILIFLRHQRIDGRFPGMIRKGNQWLGMICHYDWMQGCFLPYPALKMYYHIEKDREYLELLYKSLEAFDNYLWQYRDSDGDGCLESWCIWDTGEDNCTKHILNGLKMPEHGPWGKAYPPENYANMPYESIEYMSYSYALRNTLSKISAILNNGNEELWRTRAKAVQDKFCDYLWDDSAHVAFDRDRDNNPIKIMLASENIKCMWGGIYTQSMADDFIKYHLLNKEEFWTEYPLPSIAVNDPYFHANKNHSNCADKLYLALGGSGHDIDDNSWSGPPQGLTYQRSIGALLNYGHHAETVLVGERFLSLLKKNRRYVQQYDPFTGEYCEKAEQGYGPTMLAALEYISILYGVNIEYDTVLWSAALPGNYEYEQSMYGHSYRIKCIGKHATAYIDGKAVLEFSTGARVKTDLEGKLIAIFGIDKNAKDFEITAGDCHLSTKIYPNEEYCIENGSLALKAKIPFDYNE